MDFWNGWRTRACFFKEETAELNTSVPSFIILWSVQIKGVHPRHPPRAFPLGLRVPRCLGMGTAQIPGNEPFGFPRFLGRGSFLSPGRALLDYEESALAIPSPRFSCLCLVCSFRFREVISIQLRHSSFSHGHPSGNARGANANALDPVRLSTDELPHPFARKFCSLN